jgi:tetratricopeptide (TPR) repeat protein
MLIPLLALLLVMPQSLPEEQARKRALELHRAGQLFMQNERFEEAAGEFKKAVELDPLLMIAHYNLGQTYMALKKYPEAVAAYEGARVAIERISSIGERERGERERANRDEIHELKRTASAVRGGQMKVAQPDSMVLQLEERIRVLESLEMKGRDEVLRVPPEIDLALGSAYFRQQKLAEAEQAYAAAVAANRKLGAAHNNLAVIYMLTGRYAKAHDSIKAAEDAGFKVPAQLKADLAQRESTPK